MDGHPNGTAHARGSNGHAGTANTDATAPARRRGLVVLRAEDSAALNELMMGTATAVGPLSAADNGEVRERLARYPCTLLLRRTDRIGKDDESRIKRFRFSLHPENRVVVLPGWESGQPLAHYLAVRKRVDSELIEPEGLCAWIGFQPDWVPPDELGPGWRPAKPKEDDEDDYLAQYEAWPEPPGACVYRGILGEIVSIIEPDTEADPIGILAQAIVGVGNLIGRTAHGRVENTIHYLNEFVVLVGESSIGAKGTAGDRAMAILREVDEEWATKRQASGVPSGEGLIELVRDPRKQRQPVKHEGRVVDYQDVIVDQGVRDKRLCVFESEFGGLLRMLERQGNKLSSVIRHAWDGKVLSSPSKNSPVTATNAHVSMIGHITPAELALLNSIEAANGFGNRFLWLAVRGTKDLPSGGAPITQDMLAPFLPRLKRCVSLAKEIAGSPMEWDDDAYELWESRYRGLKETPPGLLGKLLDRGRAHVLRLAMLFSVLELHARQPQRLRRISLPALEAAFGLWDYAERSARHIFGDSLGNKYAERVLDAIRNAGEEGLSRSKIAELFKNRRLSREIAQDLGLLLRHRLVKFEREDTGGRPKETWYSSGVKRGEKGEKPPKVSGGENQDGGFGENGHRLNGVPDPLFTLLPPFHPTPKGVPCLPPPGDPPGDPRWAFTPERPSAPRDLPVEDSGVRGRSPEGGPDPAPTSAQDGPEAPFASHGQEAPNDATGGPVAAPVVTL